MLSSEPSLDDHPFFEGEAMMVYLCQDGHKTVYNQDGEPLQTIICVYLTGGLYPRDALSEPRYCGKPANLLTDDHGKGQE